MTRRGGDQETGCRAVYGYYYCGDEKIGWMNPERFPGQWTTEPDVSEMRCCSLPCDQTHPTVRWTKEEWEAWKSG